jgi:dihydrofolate reductase
MGRLVVVENISLDGVVQGPGRPDEDTRDGFRHGGWAAERLAADPEAARASFEGRGRTRGMLFGRRTYLDLVGHWLSAPEPNPFTDVLRSTPKHVASSTFTEPLPHPGSMLLRGDVTAAVAALKQQDEEGDLVVLGSAMLVRALAAADLVDAYVLTIIPVVLGSGARLFGDTFADLEVTRSVTSSTGVVVATYAVRHPG